jgi:hypothetical protein
VLLEQTLVNTGTNASVTFTADEDTGDTVDADGTVTVTVSRLTGATVSTGNASHVGDASSGTYQYAIAAQTAPDLLTIAWSCTIGGKATTITTQLEVIGGHYFSLYDLRHSDDQRGTTMAAKPISNTTNWKPELLRAARVEAESEALEAMRHSCVPRATTARVTARCHGLILAPYGRVRAIRQATAVRGAVVLDTSLWEIRGVYGDEIYAPNVCHGDTVILAFEHGEDGPPPQPVAEACMLRARHILARRSTLQPETSERARPVDGGGVVYLAQPGMRKTGNAWVDATYARHSMHLPGLG